MELDISSARANYVGRGSGGRSASRYVPAAKDGNPAGLFVLNPTFSRGDLRDLFIIAAIQQI